MGAKEKKKTKKCAGCKQDLALEMFHEIKPLVIGPVTYKRYTKKCKTCQPEYKPRRDPDAETKICTKCKGDKPLDEFRVRTENKKGKKPCTYYEPACKGCEGVQAKQYSEKVKNRPEYKEKNRARSKKYAKEHRQEIIAYRKTNRVATNPKYKKLRTDYWHNSEEQREKHKARLKKYILELSDGYVRQRMKENGWPKELITDELIEVYRLQIIFGREILKKIRELKNET